LVLLVAANFRWGYFILGNDNYSPELSPGLSFQRFIFSPAWRSYRVVGVASDADQADVFRTGLFSLLGTILPGWLLSQAWVFGCLVAGVIGMAGLTEYVGSKILKIKGGEGLFLFGGLLYLSSLLTIWVFYSPLVPFMAVWAFLPLLLLKATRWLREGKGRRGLGLAMLLMTTAGIVPTIFIVVILTVGIWLAIVVKVSGDKLVLKRAVLVGIGLILSQMFWLLPFGVYVKSNALALKESYINRMLTPEMVESEAKYNTLLNVPRYLTSWMDVRNNDGSWWFWGRDWFLANKMVVSLGYLPLIFALIGLAYLLKSRRFRMGLGLGGMMVLGWFLIKGVNAPLGGVYELLQDKLPLFEQVFRWQSSKIWPIMVFGLVILAAMGINWLSLVVGRRRGVVAALAAAGLIGYALPLFNGDLIRKGNYVKVPQEYWHLVEYLKNNGLDKERMYLAPEANTLYFRNYKWGFFGSSVLNYILPNPIVEKALTTGSMEAESAMEVIQQAFYSQNKDALTRALNEYKVGLVLLDKSVTHWENGYVYDMDLMTRMTSPDGSWEKVWSEGDLSLFRVRESEASGWEMVEEGHDWKKMAIIDSFVGGATKKLSSEKMPGSIYPLAWKYDEVRVGENEISMRGRFGGVGGDYRLEWREGWRDKKVPVLYGWKKGWVSLRPEFPRLLINGKEIKVGQAQEYKTEVVGEPRFMSVGKEVIDLLEGRVWQINLDRLRREEVAYWLAKGQEETAVLEKGARPYWLASQDSVVEMEAEINAGSPGQVNVCIWSEDNQACLSELISTVLNEGRNWVKILVGEVVERGDKITFYIEPKREGIVIGEPEVKVRVFAESKKDRYQGFEVLGETDELISIKPGDEINLVLPVIDGHESWLVNRSLNIGPEVSNENCASFTKDYVSESKVEFNGLGASFWAKNCWGGIYSKHSLVMPWGGLGMVAYEASNSSGIPLDIFIKNDKRNFSYYKERIAWKKESGGVGLVMLPEELKSYYMEVFSQGIGPRESVNQIKGMVFQFIPREWLGMKLTLDGDQGNWQVSGINEAKARGWTRKGGGEEVRINGWEQGWLANESGSYSYWPNWLAWGGYLIAIVSLIGFSFWPERDRNGKK
jgi:hypothetical protein